MSEQERAREALNMAMLDWNSSLSRDDVEGDPRSLTRAAFVAGWQAGRRFEHVTRAAQVAAERDAARGEVERLTAEVDLFSFCLDQARIVLEHFKAELPDPDHRRIAEGGLIASAPPGTLPGESPS